ncbi:hypothetical protein GCM10017779_27140 [Streptomyces capillispiralis]|nr:hypothetical protein GCM10017779_27140 [Streptomyces capillispiralis]
MTRVHIDGHFKEPGEAAGSSQAVVEGSFLREGTERVTAGISVERPQLKRGSRELTRESPRPADGAIEKRMEPNRVSIRLFGDVRSTTPK